MQNPEQMTPIVKILGSRGSIPVSGKDFVRRGGATSCVFARLAGQPVILDAGSGLLHLGPELAPHERTLPLLLSHPHADHLLGLPMWPLIFDPSRRLDIYAAPHGGLSPREQMEALLSPPLWPVKPEQFPASITFHPTTHSFRLGEVLVETMEGVHPGGVTLFRLTGGGKRVAYLTDCTLEGPHFQAAADFVRDCDLLLCDGQHTPEEWPACKHFGHNTWEMAARLGAVSGAKRTRILHHAPHRTDHELDALEARLTAAYPNCAFSYDGEEVLL